MKLHLSALSIKAKIILISIAVSFLVLLVFGSALYIYERKTAYREKELSAEQLGVFISNNFSAELYTWESVLITKSLSALSEDRDFIAARVYDHHGMLLAANPSNQKADYSPTGLEFNDFSDNSRIYRNSSGFILKIALKSENQRLGYMLTEYSYHSVKSKIKNFTVTLLTAIFTAFLLATLVSIRLQGLITKRLSKILALIKEISSSRDYSLSFSDLGSDEIGVLGQSFNLMLSEINQRDLSLRLANLSLESRVKERTKELEIAIKGLQDAQEIIYVKHKTLLASIANAPTAMAMLDTEQRMLVSSIKWFEELEDLVSESDCKILNFEEFCPDSWQQAFEKALEGETASAPEDYFKKADGSTVFIRWTIQPWYLDDEGIGGAIIAVENISDLVKTRDAAIKIAKTRSQFMANVSHELRTPLNGIIGFAAILQDFYPQGEQKEYVDLIKSSGETLLRIINDVLDFSKLERGSTELESVSFSSRGLVNEVIKLFFASCKATGTELKSEISEDVPKFVKGDEFKLKQVLTNLVGNAVKFTQNGTITLRLSHAGKKLDQDLLEFCVEDSGTGIPEDKLEDIFKPFSQADGSVTRKFGGTGLGLSIASGIVAHMGGQLQVQSELGIGSKFFFTVALSADHSACGIEPENHELNIQCTVLNGKNILVAEDNPVNLKLVSIILKKAGCVVTLAEDGIQALEAFKTQHFDLIMLDMQMPKMGGLETSGAIRTLTELGGDKIPIVALTAHAFEEDRQRCLKAGMNSFLTKPIDRAMMIKTLSELISGPQVSAVKH